MPAKQLSKVANQPESHISLPVRLLEREADNLAAWRQKEPRPYWRQLAVEPSTLQTVEEAVTAARNGHFQQALTYLYPYLESHHRDIRAHAETLVVLEWAGRYQAALILALSRSDLQLPLYAIKSVVRSARAGGFLVDAENYVALGLQQAPDDAELLSSQIHLLGDRGRLEEGLQRVLRALERHPQHADLWLAKYYLHLLRKENYAALDAVQRAYALLPSRYARRELAYSLERCGMPQLALLEAQDEPGLLTADEQFRLQREANAYQIRWGVYEPARPEDRYVETDRALLRLDHLLTELQSGDLEHVNRHQQVLLFNRMVALRDRRYMQQVVDLWQQLTDAKIEIPDYALQAAADALLYLQRPVEAASLYAAISARSANNFTAQVGLYYSLHESNQYAQATALIERLVAAQPVWFNPKGYRVAEENPDRFSAELTAALDRLYRNELVLADERLRLLSIRGPHNLELRQALGALESARRHPRKARILFEQGLSIEPEHVGLQVALADSFMVRRQWRLAEQSIARQVSLFPDEGSSLRLQDEWQRYRMRELEGRFSLGFGTSPSVDGQEISWLLRNWTRPLDYDWRLAAFVENRFGKLPEGRAARTYGGVAFERRTPDLSLFGQFSLADVSRERLSTELSGRYEFSDSWALFFTLARNGGAVSLRALEAGTGGSEYRLGGEWWRHESLSVSLELSLLDYDDDNQRTSFSAVLRQRLSSGPTFQLENIVRTAVSQNSRSGGFYFAPDSDLLIEDELQARWISWRRYADTFTQRASLAAGGYWQQNFGWSLPLAISYAHEWELQQRRLFVEYGPSFSYRHYDGAAETNLGFSLSFSWRY